ncbi:MAG TPA: hypothetical protein VKA67_07830, partial [Verrucomicrobiae bacterium]|nr:hypothetical protein [Verrucomicrobiae bacterium]
MKSKWLLCFGAACVALNLATADDIKTLDGRTYLNVSEIKTYPDGISFKFDDDSGGGLAKVEFRKLPDDLKKKYHYDPFKEGFYLARQNKAVYLRKDMAFSLSQLDEAKKKAKAEHKPIGFIMVWDRFFRPAWPMRRGSPAGLAHFYDVFHNGLVLVFVRHENELGAVPDAVKRGFNGPEEGGYAPNMAVVSSDCSRFICEIPYGGDHSNGAIRDQIFREKIGVIKKYIEDSAVKKSQ